MDCATIVCGKHTWTVYLLHCFRPHSTVARCIWSECSDLAGRSRTSCRRFLKIGAGRENPSSLQLLRRQARCIVIATVAFIFVHANLFAAMATGNNGCTACLPYHNSFGSSDVLSLKTQVVVLELVGAAPTYLPRARQDRRSEQHYAKALSHVIILRR